MPDYLADTNVIFRWATPDDSQYTLCRLAMRHLHNQHIRVFVTGQILLETWALMTRPVEANGQGLSATEALRVIRRICRNFPLLVETAEVYPRWQRLAERYGIIGRQVYDTRLVAVMQVNRVTHLVTLNVDDF